MKRQTENIAKLEAGVDYNGISFSKNVIDSCKRSVERDKREKENDND